MQHLNWNDFRYLLAVSRGRTLSAAARLLGVDDTTVARRLAAVRELTGARLYQRLADGTLQLTPTGQRAALHAERIESEIGLLSATLSGGTGSTSGTVRITSVPIIINRVLTPASAVLLKRHPDLQLELIADARDFSLTRREADVALRLARPRAGGSRVTARRIGTLAYDVYAAAAQPTREARLLPWVTYDEAIAHLPQVRWIAAAAAAKDEPIAPVRVNDAEAVLEAVAAGLGRSLLPCMIADRDTRLIRLAAKRHAPSLRRELWLLTHSELRTLGRIRTVVDWIEKSARG